MKRLEVETGVATLVFVAVTLVWNAGRSASDSLVSTLTFAIVYSVIAAGVHGYRKKTK
jgi:hypothetical protein